MNTRKLLILLIIFLCLVIFFRSTAWLDIKWKIQRSFTGSMQNSGLVKDMDTDLKFVSEVDKKKSRVAIEDLVSSGSGKDGIPAIKDPKFDTANKSGFSDKDLVIGVYFNEEAKAYPLKILYQHEIVNDKIGEEPIAVTYCPLCNTDPVFLRTVGAEETTFGVTGKLYQSCLVMYDSNTDTYWSQPWGLGILGENVNQVLKRIPAVRTTLGAWKDLHPETLILSKDTGYIRNYSSEPYKNYFESEEILYPVRNQDKLIRWPKDNISYIWQMDQEAPLGKFSGEAMFVSNDFVRENSKVDMIFNGELITASWDESLGTVLIEGSFGETIPVSTAFAFVYPAFFE